MGPKDVTRVKVSLRTPPVKSVSYVVETLAETFPKHCGPSTGLSPFPRNWFARGYAPPTEWLGPHVTPVDPRASRCCLVRLK